jgi:hypothetical protein
MKSMMIRFIYYPNIGQLLDKSLQTLKRDSKLFKKYRTITIHFV